MKLLNSNKLPKRDNPRLGSHIFNIFGTWGRRMAMLKSKQFVNPFLDVKRVFTECTACVCCMCYCSYGRGSTWRQLHCRCVNKLVHLGYKQLFFKLNFCHFQLKFELGLNSDSSLGLSNSLRVKCWRVFHWTNYMSLAICRIYILILIRNIF